VILLLVILPGISIGLGKHNESFLIEYLFSSLIEGVAFPKLERF